MRHIIALDIGGSKIEGALFNERYGILCRKRVYFQKRKTQATVTLSKQKALGMICGLIDELKRGVLVSGIGVSIPDIITKDGSILGISKIRSLSNFALGRYILRKYRCRVAVANDASCFALGEAMRGAGKGYRNVIGVIYGTGIGSGIIINGSMYTSTTGSAGEFGHNIIDSCGPRERTGLRGTVESFAAGPHLVSNYLKAGGRISDPDPRKIYYSTEKVAKCVMRQSLDKFAIGVAQLVNILNPDIIILGGGLSNLPVYPTLNRLTKRYAFSHLKQGVRIVKNRLGDSAGIYGAAALVLEK